MLMMEFWKAALKIGGPVSVVGFLVWVTVTRLFEKELLDRFSSEQQFTLVIIIVCGLLICLLAALFTFRKKNDSDSKPSTGNKATFNRSTIEGDVVLGDKHEGRK